MHIVVQNIGGRDYMEDTFIVSEKIINNIDLYCVFDGHGGDFVANFLKNNYTNILTEIIRENQHSIPDMIFKSFQEVVKRIPKEQSMHCGSTALVALKYGEVLFIANAGDCRAIINKNSQVIPITVDHKPNLKKEYDRIQQNGGFVTFNQYDAPRVNGNLAVSRSIGDFALYPHVTWVPDIYITKLEPFNNYLILASDGLWDTMNNEDVNNIYTKHITENKDIINYEVLKESTMESLQTARIKGSTDNITILVTTLQ